MLELADKLWRGEVSIEDAHPFAPSLELFAVAPRTAFIQSFGNVTAFDTNEGIVLVDTGSQFVAPGIREALRKWSPSPVHTIVYTHGHVDHVMGAGLYDGEAVALGRPKPQVLAHEAVVARFQRYRLTAGYNALINRRQFGVPNLTWPTEFRLPDRVYHDTLFISVGGERFELHHARGETDDATWVWVPDRRIVACGDLFIWTMPNCGNPQKVQRYALDWVHALHDIAAQRPEILLPGHGLPIVGKDRVRQTLLESAELLQSLHDQTVDLMNRGADLDQIIHSVKPPEHLVARPYLKALYDEPEFIVRNIWRLYGGWWDGDPAQLKPAPLTSVALEVARLSGGAGRLAERAREVAEAGDLRLACHLVELAAHAAPDDPVVRSARSAIYGVRAKLETSTMARGIFNWAAGESQPPKP